MRNPRRKPKALPRYVRVRLLRSGAVAYFWEVPPSARPPAEKHGQLCPVESQALGTNLEIAIKRAVGLNARLDDWRNGEPTYGLVGHFRKNPPQPRPRRPKQVDRLDGIWRGMHARCSDLECEGYGGRGIAVCEEWSDFDAFAAWARANGYGDRLSIDRIDNDGNYEPSNCRWTDQFTQMRNTRRTVWVDLAGERLALSEAVERLGVDYDRAYNLHRRQGIPFDDVASRLTGLRFGQQPPRHKAA